MAFWPISMIRSVYNLHKAARLNRRGKTEQATKILGLALDSKIDDHRLAIRMAIDSGDYSYLHDIEKQKKEGHQVARLFLAYQKTTAGEHENAAVLAREAVENTPGNMTASALLALSQYNISGDTNFLIGGIGAFPHASLKVQGMILLAVEKAVMIKEPSDTGAAEKEETTGGVSGWFLGLLDDLAIWIYWLISLVLNLVINISDAEKRAVYWRVIEGDRLEGLGKNGPAVEKFRQALELSADCIEALESMVKHSMELKEYKEAGEYLERLKEAIGEAGAEDPSLSKWEADLDFFLGRYEKAMQAYEALEAQFPLSYIVGYRIGFCALRLEDAPKAAANFEKALGMINSGLLEERVARLSPAS